MQAKKSLERPFSHWWDWERTDTGCLWSPNLSLVTWRFQQSYCLWGLKKLAADVGDDGGGSSRSWAGLIFCERDTNWKCLERGNLNWGIPFIRLTYEHIWGGIFLIANSWRGPQINVGSATPECWSYVEANWAEGRSKAGSSITPHFSFSSCHQIPVSPPALASLVAGLWPVSHFWWWRVPQQQKTRPSGSPTKKWS